MTIKCVPDKQPYRKYNVKNMPKDVEYRQQSINDNAVYYSKTKQSHYEVMR
jgi:hypothetical protein